MNSTKSFPPADDLLSLIGKVDWKQVGNVTLEGINEFLAIVEFIVAYVAAFCVVCYQKWQQHSMTDKAIKMAQKAYTFTTEIVLPNIITSGQWLRGVAYPEARQSVLNSYTFIKTTSSTVSDIYNLINARQFTIL